MSLLYADAPVSAAAAASPGSPLDSLFRFGPLVPMVAIFGLFWFLFIRPQQKQAKERVEQLKELKEGDKVVLVSGVHATVVRVDDEDTLQLQIAEGVKIKAQRTAVDRKISPPGASDKKAG
jgi:preprotein translocase subunit YajC